MTLRVRSKVGQLLLAHVAALGWAGEASAQPRDPQITRDAADNEITVEANGATLGQILDRLFAERGIEVDWRDQALAGKVIEGSFRGPLDQVTRRLLSGENYIAISTRTDGETGIARIVIIGRAFQAELAPRLPVEAQVRQPLPARPGSALGASRFPKKKIYR